MVQQKHSSAVRVQLHSFNRFVMCEGFKSQKEKK